MSLWVPSLEDKAHPVRLMDTVGEADTINQQVDKSVYVAQHHLLNTC